MTDSQATDFFTFEFKGLCVSYFAVGSTDHRTDFLLVHYVAKLYNVANTIKVFDAKQFNGMHTCI